MLLFKPGVKLKGVRPEIAAALITIHSIIEKYGEVVITAVTDGQHSVGSKHYIGCAVDVRSTHLNEEQKQEVFKQLKTALTDEFVILLERTPEHYHIQYAHNVEIL